MSYNAHLENSLTFDVLRSNLKLAKIANRCPTTEERDTWLCPLLGVTNGFVAKLSHDFCIGEQFATSNKEWSPTYLPKFADVSK